jgi:hypothetical protein
MNPNIQQDKGQSHQDKPTGWVVGRRPSPHQARATVAGFDTEAFSVQATNSFGSEVEVALTMLD